MGWFGKKKRSGPTGHQQIEETPQFLIPREVDWTVNDVLALEEAGQWQEALTRWQVLYGPFEDPQFADQIAGLHSRRIILEHIGVCSLRLSRAEEGLEALTKAESLGREAGDGNHLVDILKHLGWAHRIRGNAGAALGCLDEALTMATAQGRDDRMLGDIHDERSLCYGVQGNMAQALEEAHVACTLATGSPSSDASVETRLLTNLAVSYIQMDRREEAAVLYEKALVKAREAGNAAQETTIRENLAACRKGGA